MYVVNRARTGKTDFLAKIRGLIACFIVSVSNATHLRRKAEHITQNSLFWRLAKIYSNPILGFHLSELW